MATTEELIKLLAEENRKAAEVNRKAAEEYLKFKEENRIGFEELRGSIKELRESIEELREVQKKNEEENRIAFEELREGIEELREGIKELREIQKKNEEENRIGFEKLRESLRKTDNNFNTQWGRLVEALVNNQVLPLLQNRGFAVAHTMQQVKGNVNGHNYEFDIIAVNGDSIVVVEVKTTLQVGDVKEFLDELSNFKAWLPHYSNVKVYGAVAFLRETSKAATFADKCGLFTILATGSSAMITNPENFEPKEF